VQVRTRQIREGDKSRGNISGQFEPRLFSLMLMLPEGSGVRTLLGKIYKAEIATLSDEHEHE